MMQSFNTQHKNNGATLIISLVILAVLTVVGVASMQNSGLELKMISSAHDRSVAFEAAEAAILRIEENLTNNPPPYESHYSDCAGNNCFAPDCTGGLCFDGTFNVGSEREQCYVANANDASKSDFWNDQTLDVWNNANKHQTMAIAGLNTPVKYIVEFLCFANVGLEVGAGFSTAGESLLTSENENYRPLYRITALADGLSLIHI